MIKEILFYRMRIAEYVTNTYRILKIITANASEGVTFLPYKERIEQSLLKLEDAQRKVNTQILTGDIHQKDLRRDFSLMALDTYALACSRRLDDEWSEAGKLIQNEINSHGSNITRKPRAIETAIIKAILAKLRTDKVLVNAANTINAEVWIAEIENSQKEFELSVTDRKDTKSTKSDEVSSDACKEIRSELESFFKYLEVMVDLEPKTEFTNISKEINVVIDEINNTVAQRVGRQAKKEDESETQLD